MELAKEKLHLKKTIIDIGEVLEEEKELLKEFYQNYRGDGDDLWRLAENRQTKINYLESSLNNPYFARIDFTFNENHQKEVVYIGKNGVIKDNDVIVTDWRAPISALYYDSEIGACSFNAPDGMLSGVMDLKRQFEIEKGELINYFDVDLVSNDELLQRYLTSNNDARLKSIVATIQKEQNNIIRKNLNHDLIIQGVAGSGKTTVALHRIAYLVYNYSKNISQRQYLVIGPNPVFLKYVKSVLPELDVSFIRQYTFEELCKEYIDEKISFNDSSEKLILYINGENNNVDKFKCSLKFKTLIDTFFYDYQEKMINEDILLGDFILLSKGEIKAVFNETFDGTYETLKSKVEITIQKLINIIAKNKNKYVIKYNDYMLEGYNLLNENEQRKLRHTMLNAKKDIEKGCKGLIRSYFHKKVLSVSKFYRIFIENIDKYNTFDIDSELIKKQTLTNIKKSKYDFEDLAALMYFKVLISGNDNLSSMRQVVVDEAQDFGLFNFAVLKKCFPNANFSIFGDLAQSIYNYHGIDNWESVANNIFGGQAEIICFNKSYRTTAQIMHEADKVALATNNHASDLVIRQGSEVVYTHLSGKDKCSYILNRVTYFQKKGYKTIAIISKTDKMSENINIELKKCGLDIPNVNDTDDLTDSKFRICTISNHLAKGLEFDAVILNDASENIYQSNNKLDMCLLYVALTRALHELNIIYHDELSYVLSK